MTVAITKIMNYNYDKGWTLTMSILEKKFKTLHAFRQRKVTRNSIIFTLSKKFLTHQVPREKSY